MSSIFPDDVKPPAPIKIPHSMSLHEDTRIDPYFWMKERDTERVLEHLKSENAYYEAMTKSWQPLQDRVFEEMKARVKQDDASPPAKNGPYYYYSKFSTGLEYPIYCRRKDLAAGDEEIILDVNEIAKGHTYTSVSGALPSPDHRTIVFGVDLVGRRFYDLHFKDLKSGAISSLTVPATTGNIVWAEDSRTIFYTLQNLETLRAEKVVRFDFTTGESSEVFFEQDETFSVYVSKSQNDKYIFINTASFDSSEVRLIPSLIPTAEPTTFHGRETKHEYTLEDGDDGFYILTNWHAENFRLMKADSPQLAKESWTDVISHRSDVYLADMLLLKNQIVLDERVDGLKQIEIVDRNTKQSALVRFPDATYLVGITATNYEYDATSVRFKYQSLVRPPCLYDFEFATGQMSVVKQTEVPTYDASKYASERVWATASDGTKIPISLVYRKDLKQPGRNPLLVYGYGSYGYSTNPNFRLSIFSLLDRGFVYALAHVRGGSEMGRSWYENGRMSFKKNTFTDFNSVTEFLVEQGYGDPSRVFAMGGSAGGLLMGAISNLRPDLYRGIVSVVPFVDVLTTMLDPDIPLTTAEYEQWGNPNDPAAYTYIKSYSPYDGLEHKPYPAMLVMTGYHDSQVQYWEPAKYVAKLRDVTTSNQPILFRIDMEAGHAGASGRFQALKDSSYELGFLIQLAGVSEGMS